MIKKILIIGMCILFVTTIIVTYNIIDNRLPSGKLIVMNEAINKDKLDGISIINLRTNKTNIISQVGRYSCMDYCEKRNSVYAVSQEDSGESEIFEISLDNKETQTVKLRVNEDDTRKYEYLKCVPNRNAISYSDNGNIYFYDFDTEKESILISDCHDYSWNKNGTKIIYGNLKDMFIHEFDLTLKKDINLKINGYSPQYSSDEKFINFFKYRGNVSYPCVRRVSDGYEWIYKNNDVWEICISKDASKLLMRQTSFKWFGGSYPELIVWDYKKNKVKKLHITYRSNSQYLLIE